MELNKVREAFYKYADGNEAVINIAEHIIEALEKMKDRELAETTVKEIIDGKLKISKCYDKITEKAHEMAKNKISICLQDEVVYKMAREYFHIDAQYQKSKSALDLDFDSLFA